MFDSYRQVTRTTQVIYSKEALRLSTENTDALDSNEM